MKDVKVGRPNAYRSVRDLAAPPFGAIERELSVQVIRQRWPKEGRQSLKLVQPAHSFDLLVEAA